MIVVLVGCACQTGTNLHSWHQKDFSHLRKSVEQQQHPHQIYHKQQPLLCTAGAIKGFQIRDIMLFSCATAVVLHVLATAGEPDVEEEL